MTASPNDSERDEPDGMAKSVRRERDRQRLWRAKGEPSVMRFVGQIGVLGWIIVTPTLIGVFLGRWLDHRFDSGVFWSAALLFVGVTIGFWSAWHWMHSEK
jgi:ATP synthase protein I